MLDYTKAIMTKTKNDIDTAVTLFRFGTQILYVAYLIYLLLSLSNIWYLYLALLVISVAFLIFDLVTTNQIHIQKEARASIFGNRQRRDNIRNAKRKRESVRKVKFYVSHSIKIFVLASSLYPMIISPETVHPISIICTTVMSLTWLLLIVFEVVKMVLDSRIDLFYEAMRADIEFVTKPASAVKDTINKILGREVEEKPEASKERVYLDELVQSNKNEKAEIKKAKKAERTEKIATWFDEHLPKKKKKSEEAIEVVEEPMLTTVTDSDDE